jgi:hypothetical protein
VSGALPSAVVLQHGVFVVLLDMREDETLSCFCRRPCLRTSGSSSIMNIRILIRTVIPIAVVLTVLLLSKALSYLSLWQPGDCMNTRSNRM